MADFYPRPPRGGRHSKSGISAANVQISIHALREEGDIDPTDVCVDLIRFLSTPSARRATPSQSRRPLRLQYFYPRPPRGGRPELYTAGRLFNGISIHALREEGDHSRRVRRHRHGNFYPRPPRGGRPRTAGVLPSGLYFYPRPPRGGRRPAPRRSPSCWGISIHALREEGDTGQAGTATKPGNFYPRPPRGGRLLDY